MLKGNPARACIASRRSRNTLSRHFFGKRRKKIIARGYVFLVFGVVEGFKSRVTFLTLKTVRTMLGQSPTR